MSRASWGAGGHKRPEKNIRVAMGTGWGQSIHSHPALKPFATSEPSSKPQNRSEPPPHPPTRALGMEYSADLCGGTVDDKQERQAEAVGGSWVWSLAQGPGKVHQEGGTDRD